MPPSLLAKAGLLVLGLCLLAAGLFFAFYGYQLVTLQGSWYFLLSGLALIAAGVQVARQRASGALIYGATFVATVVWALADAGLDFWPLVSRLLLLAGLGILVALAFPVLRRASAQSPQRCASRAVAGVLTLACLATVGGMFLPHASVAAKGDATVLQPVPAGQAPADWAHYGNTPGATRFAALDQITRSNVKDLQVAWTYRTGDVPVSPGGGGAEDQLTPLQIGNKVFVCTPHNNVIALDATTGKELWKTEINAKQKKWMRCRGLAYFDATQPLVQPSVAGATPVKAVSVAAGAACQRRVLMNSVAPELVALDADTGAFCEDFGTHGRVDLRAGMGKGADKGQYYPTSAPTLAGTTIVIGGRVADNVSTDMPGGVVRGFDVITGAQRWAFDPGNPEDQSAPADGKTYVRSTPNVWAPCPTTPSPTPCSCP